MTKITLLDLFLARHGELITTRELREEISLLELRAKINGKFNREGHNERSTPAI